LTTVVSSTTVEELKLKQVGFIKELLANIVDKSPVFLKSVQGILFLDNRNL